MGLIILSVGLPLLFLRDKVTAPEWMSYREMGRTLMLIPIILFAVMSFGILDGITLSLWRTFSALKGASENWSAYTLYAFIAGNVVIQPLIGWAADLFGRRVMLRVCALGGALGGVLMSVIDFNSLLVIPLGIVWGGLAFGVYTVSLAFVGTHLRGAQLITANAAFGVVWGLGNVVGAPASGKMIETFGAIGMPLSVTAVYVVLTIAAFAFDPVGKIRGER
jgi:MFS family permease